MINMCWEVFKKTGSIEAYLYMANHSTVSTDEEQVREIEASDDNSEHPGDSTQSSQI